MNNIEWVNLFKNKEALSKEFIIIMLEVTLDELAIATLDFERLQKDYIKIQKELRHLKGNE